MYNNYLHFGLQPYKSKRVSTRDAAASKKKLYRLHQETPQHTVSLCGSPCLGSLAYQVSTNPS